MTFYSGEHYQSALKKARMNIYIIKILFNILINNDFICINNIEALVFFDLGS